MEVESGEKMLGCVTRGDESDGGVGLRVTLEVGSAGVKPLVKFVKMEVESRENARVCNARSRIRWWCWSRGDVGG